MNNFFNKLTGITGRALQSDIHVAGKSEVTKMAQDIEMQEVSSSNVAAVGYDSDSSTLRVQFTNGSVYDYDGVSEEEYDSLVTADSVGSYLNSNIKGIYAHTKIE